VFVTIIVIAFIGLGFPHMSFNSLVGATYQYHSRYFAPWRMYGIWNLCLCAGYIVHWIHVRQHVDDMRRFAQQISNIFVKQQIPPVRWPDLGWAGEPFWIAAAIIGAASAAWWAIPAALAGMAQQRYVRHTSGRVRAELARGLRAMLVQDRPAVDVPTPYKLRAKCANRLCLHSVPLGAVFCPRCGTRQQQPVDAVA
jgi:hypothetical protein